MLLHLRTGLGLSDSSDGLFRVRNILTWPKSLLLGAICELGVNQNDVGAIRQEKYVTWNSQPAILLV